MRMGWLFSINIHYGGQFVQTNQQVYEGGQLYVEPNCDADLLSMIEFKNMVENLGYKSFVGLWFRAPFDDTTDPLRPLKTDSDVLILGELMCGVKEVNVYVEHEKDNVARENGKDIGADNEDWFYNEGEGGADNEGEDAYYNEAEADDDSDGSWDDDNVAIVCKEFFQYVGPQMSENVLGEWEKMINDNDDMRSICSSSDDEDRSPYPIFRVPYDPENIIFEVGMLFSSLKLFKEVVTDYAVHDYRCIRFVKCEKDRVRAKCVKGCNWLIYARRLPNKIIAQVKTYVNRHSCARTSQNKNFSVKWIAKNVVTTVRAQPGIKAADLQKHLTERFGLGCTRSKVFRARRLAMNIADGDYVEQYAFIRDFAEEILRANPGSTCIVKCTFPPTVGPSKIENGPRPKFERMYMCLQACKIGFKACRPIIGVDGCHQKGPCGGILLTATGIDPNENIFPIAVAAVEAETKDSWSWFIQLLLDDIGKERHLTFISDQQKGLVPALAEISPSSAHRFCVRHLQGNFRKLYSALQLKELMWAAAKSTHERAFEAVMHSIKEINQDARKWLDKLDRRSWSMHAFEDYSKCDMVSNNISESWNAMLLEAREKPIITMMDMIRVLLMERFQNCREMHVKFDGRLCPNIQSKVEAAKKDINSWICRFAGEDHFEVTNVHQRYIVHLGQRTCSCRKWNITGIPCVHAMTAIIQRRFDVESYVDNCYSKDTYAKCYEGIVYPINGSEMWPRSALPRPLPPKYNRAPGRPKKLRRREADETPATGRLKRKLVMTCKKCNQQGHNKRTCGVGRVGVKGSSSSAGANRVGSSVGPTSNAPSSDEHSTTRVKGGESSVCTSSQNTNEREKSNTRPCFLPTRQSIRTMRISYAEGKRATQESCVILE